MARDSFDESKNKKKKDEKKAVAPKPQSSSVKNVNQKANKSTFLGGGAPVNYAKNNQTKKKTPTVTNKETANNAIQRSNKSTFMGGVPTTKSTQPSTRRDETVRQKMTGGVDNSDAARERRVKRYNVAQAQKSGDFDRASELHDELYGKSKIRTQINRWDKDITDTITHTVKQGLAADARVANLGMKGITQKDAFLYTTPEQRRKADEKVARKDEKLGKRIETETKAIQDIQNRHGYLGKQALSAVSSTTGMGMDIAAGAIIPGSSLFHMWARSTGTSLGEVNKRADNLRKQLKSTGQYSDSELDEMFRNVDALDMANAAASGGVEVLSELLFPGMGAARKVIGGKGMSIAERAGAKLFNRVGEKAAGGLLRNVARGTGEEVLEEEIGGPLQSLASNLIYGNRFQGYNEEAVKRSLAEQSSTLRSNIRSEADAQAASARLSSKAFMDESVKSYMQSGYSKEEATKLAEMSRDYLTASLSGDVDAMKKYQDDMVNVLAGGENSQKQKFGLQDAIDAAVSTSMMTIATGMPSAVSTMQIGNSYKQSAGLDAIKQQAEMIKNWETDPKEKERAQAIIDHIDNGGDLSGTQVYEIVQKTGELAESSKQPEQLKNRMAQVEMQKRDLRISPVNPDGTLAPQTSQRFERIVSDTISRHEALARIGEDDEYSASDVAVGANIGAAFNTGVINAEMVNELARGSEGVKAVFKEVTGIDTKQFDSYSEMNDALMARAADNMVNSARLEQVAWNDESRKQLSDYLRSDIGSKGDIAIQNALESVDPRDRTQFLMTGDVSRNVYEFARRTDGTWNEARARIKEMYPSVNTNILRQVFDAAKQDKEIAETKAYGKVVTSGKEMNRNSLSNAETAFVPGVFNDKRTNKEGATLSEESLLKSFVSAFGINIDLVDSLESVVRDKDGNVVLDEEGNPLIRQDNGMFDPSTNTLTVNANADTTRTITQTAVHELTHHIAVHAPAEYVKLSRYIMDAWYRQDAEGYTRAIRQRQALYKAQKNQELSDEQALEEIIADGAADFNWADADFIAEVTSKEPTLANKIIDAIKEVLRKLRSILASDDVIDEQSRNALYDKVVEFDTVRSLWVKAAQTARKAQADQAIDEWQDRSNKQNSPRLSVGEEKYSITTDKEDFIKGANLSKDLRDWAKDMGLDKLSKQPIKGPVIVSVRDLRTAWYEKNGRAEEADVINTALDKIGDSLTQLVGKYQYIDLGDALNAAVTYRTDSEGHPTSVILSCQVKNAEYEVNFDFTTICAKRLAMQKILERFIKTEGERQGTTLYDELKLDEEGLYKLRLILETAGFEVSCRGCFVEQNRYSQQNQARTIANDWNAAIDEWEKENNTKVTENFDLVNMDINALNYEEIQEAFNNYTDLMSGRDTNVETKNRTLIEAHPFFRKRMNPSDYASTAGQRALMAIGVKQFRTKDGKSKKGTTLYGLLKRGQSDSKQSVPFTAYNGEISLLPDNMKGKNLYDYLLSIGGARAQSASDFQIEFVYDYMQMVADLSARGLPMHMYTKVIELAELFGMTGIKINLSAMCDVAEDVGGEYAGLKLVDGKYEYNISDQSIDYEKAVELQKKEGYSKNIGIIMVTLSSQHMLKSLDDPDVRYIIGYHSSAMPVVVANMSNMGGATDYTKINKTNKLNEKGQALFDAAMAEAKGDTELEKYKDALRIFDEKIQQETAKKKKRPRRGNEYGAYMSAYGNNTADFNTYGNLLETKDARKTADKYLEHCMENDLIPIYFPFAFHENYYKCEIYDFNMYDNNTGEYAPMGSVQNIYPGLNMAAGETDTTAFTERVSEMMDERNRLNESLDSQYDAVFDEAKKELKYSITGDDYMDFDASGIDHNELTHRADAPMTAEQQRDADYMDAVNSGNMDEAQRLVDEAAKMAGYSTKKMYHGTPNFGFTVFDGTGFRDHDGWFFSDRKDAAESYAYGEQAGTYAVYLNFENPLTIDAEGQDWTDIQAYTSLDARDRAKEIDARLDEIRDAWRNGTDNGEYDRLLDELDELESEASGGDTDSWVRLAKENGHDGLIIHNIIDYGASYEGEEYEPFTEYIAFNQEQIKSADTVTYAEDGSVIPLSERFDPSNNDIRYSLPTQDADGKILTDGQMEYFKNSQARDIFGRLVPVYHATDMGGFTIFDPWKSDDHRSLFFSDRRDVAKTYAYNGGNAFDFTPRELNDWGDLVQYGRQLFSNADMSWDDDTDDNNLNFELYDKETGNFADIGYDEWLSLVENNDPHADDYKVKIKLPYNNKDGETECVSFEGDSAEDLLNKVSNGNIPHGGHYQVYLNLENPLIIDGQGQPWNDIVDGGSVFPAYSYVRVKDAEWYRKDADNSDEMYALGQRLYNGDDSRSKAEELSAGDLIEIEIFDGKKKHKVMTSLDADSIAQEVANAFGIDDMEIVSGVAEEIALDMEVSDSVRFDHTDLRNTIGEYGYSTREWAEFAEDEGYDGVIFRSIIDTDNKTEMFDSEEEAASDIYVAFSSNQVKDINNENPSENPDIRYSFADDEESKSRIAYNDAMDDSYELLAYYETQISNVNPETFDVTKAFKEEDVARFLDALKAEDSVPSDDAKFEEDRVRRARSKEDFYSNINAKWNDRWITEGEVLKISSVKRDITNLVKGAMANSDSDAQYRNEIVKKTLVDARIAYQLMKQDRTELASYLLYHSAQRMIDGLEFIRDDTAFKEYQGIRDFMRQYRIEVPDKYWEDPTFLDFRKEYFGRLRIAKGGEHGNIEDIYKDLADNWPHLFSESQREKTGLKEQDDDLLYHIGEVIDSNVTPFMEAYSSEEATSLAFDLADQLYEIIANGDREVSLADSYKERLDARTKAMKARHAEAIHRIQNERETERQAFKAYKEKQSRKLKTQKAKADFEIATLKQNREYNIQRLKAEKARAVREERQKARWKEEERRERTLHNKYFKSIQKTHKKLTERLLNNTKDSHIPEQYKRELAGLLKAFDLQTVGSKQREARTGYKAQNTIKLEAMRTALEQIEANSQFFHINDSITDIMKDLLGMNEDSVNRQSIEGKTIDELSASELKKVDKLLGSLIHEFNNYEKVKVGVKKAQAADIGHAQNDISLGHANVFGAGRDYQNTPGWIDKILNLDEMTAAYLFKRIDPNNEGLGLMWKEIRRSFDKYVRNQNQLNEWMEEIVGKYHNKGILWNKYGSGELTNWRSDNYAHTFNLENGTIRLTIAQMMSVACLANRQQAYDHMTGNGVVVAPVTFNAKMLSDLKKKPNKALPVKLTDADIKTIVAALTPEQRQVANKLQQLMATKMAEWGNEASVNVIGIKLFEDPDYFPIRSDRAGLTKDLDPNQFEQAIRNFGFTKAVQPGAKNAIMIDDIFDVVTEHCNNMNLYNSYTEAMNDFMKVYNYREAREEGEYTVEQALRHAYSDKAPTFIMQFMRDLNGNVSRRASGIEDAYNSLLANSKKAAVFANLRVAAQQPTAITRAFAVIDPKYIKGIKVEKGAMEEMFEHCPIALWKSWGYYDINMGKSIEDIMMNNGRWLEDKATDLYGALDNVTWTAIWQMVKAEMKDTHPNVEAGTDEYWELCNERMSEIVDLTQVVDSPMHRSHAMRDKGFLKKTATAFMAEPTLTFNMIRDGWINAREAWKQGEKGKAIKIARRTAAVSLLQAATVAGAAAIVDALRKKKPDKDDEDDRFLHLWWVNALENFEDELKLWNKIYFIKDIASIFDGWENANLALQGIQKFALGYRQLTGDPYARSSAEWYENMADGIGYMWGIPIKTIRTGLANAMNNVGISSPVLEAIGDNLSSMAKDSDSEKEAFIGNLLSDDSQGMFGKLLTTKSDGTESEESSINADDLPDNLTDEQKQEIIKAGEKRAKKKAGEEAETTEQLDYDKMLYDAMKAAAGLEGEEYNKKIYSSVAQGLKGYIAEGDYTSIGMMRTVIEEAGGDVAYFDQRVMDETKSAYKKTLGYELSYEERWDQKAMYRYMMQHGMTQEELSSEILYKSDLAKDMKVAYRIGDNEMIYEAMLPLVDAGITKTDLERIYDNRNRMDLTKYSGRYKDRLKSTGKFIWPASGPLTSHFGYRNAPTAGASSNHPAIDIGVPVGTSVVAADGGVIIYAGRNSGYGNSVGIKHDNGMVTYYNHLDSWNVKVGDTVAQGQQIALSGNTGISTGPHLDFKILDAKGNPVDPEKYLGK